MKELKEKLHLKHTELLVLLIFFLFSLRVLNWFEYPYIVVGGDFRPPLVHEAFLKRITFTWDEIDFGIPSVYTPRILNPFYFFVTAFQILGVSLYLSQIIAVFLIYLFSSILMYIFVKQVTNGNITASFVAALYLTSNVYLVNDREVTAIGFMTITLIILPCLVTFVKGIKTCSYKLMAVSGILFVLTYATFPNYRTTLICLIMLCLVSLFFFIGKGLQVSFHKERISLNTILPYHSLKLLAMFGMVFLLASFWVVAIIFSNFETLTATYAEISMPWFVGGLEIYDVTRLIARWGFYSGAFGMPYIPYKDTYLSNPLTIFLCYLPVIMAFTSLLLSKEHKITIFFGIAAIIFIFLTSGFSFSEYGSSLYFSLMGLPLLKAFREASNWIFFVIIFFGILIGCTTSALCDKFKKKTLKILVVGLVVGLFLYTAYPLTTGDVTRNWLNHELKGSTLPPSYTELNHMLSSKFWTLLLPQRGTYVVYNFTEGNFSCGNPYPFIFSKPVISGVGTEYVQPENMGLINKLHELIQTNINYENVAPEGKASASSVESEGLEPSKANDGLRYGQNRTRWASKVGVPQWSEIEWNKTQEIFKINIIFESAYADDYIIETWDGSNWTTQIIVENNTSTEREHIFPQTINTTKLRLNFTKASPHGLVSIWELEVYARTEGVPKFLGMLGIKHIILEKNIIFGNTYSVNELKLRENENFNLIKEWEEAALFENSYALHKLHVANNLLNYTTLDDMYKSIENSEWNTLKHSAFINAASPNEANKTLITPENFVWREVSPIKYEANVESNGSFVLVFLESYNEHWKLYINGKQVSETKHLKVNAFANGWLINETGNLTMTIQYEIQNLLAISVVASVILPMGLLTFLSRRDIKRVASLIQRRFKRKIDQTKKGSADAK